MIAGFRKICGYMISQTVKHKSIEREKNIRMKPVKNSEVSEFSSGHAEASL